MSDDFDLSPHPRQSYFYAGLSMYLAAMAAGLNLYIATHSSPVRAWLHVVFVLAQVVIIIAMVSLRRSLRQRMAQDAVLPSATVIRLLRKEEPWPTSRSPSASTKRSSSARSSSPKI